MVQGYVAATDAQLVTGTINECLPLENLDGGNESESDGSSEYSVEEKASLSSGELEQEDMNEMA